MRTARVTIASVLVMAATAHAIPSVLVYTATAGYRHDSIPTAIQVLGDQAQSNNVSFSFTEDRTKFTDDNLANFDAVMFVSNSDEVLDDPGKEALQTYFRSGGVYVGVHSASACLFNSPFYGQEVGAFFDYHPSLQQATFNPVNKTHPSTAMLPDEWTFEEEVYYFRSDPRSIGAELLITVDESSYNNTGGQSTGDYTMGSPHPIAWYQISPPSAQPLVDGAPGAGRSFYTSLGHNNSTWQDPTFQAHVFGGLKWALDGATTRAYGVGLVGNADSVEASSSLSSSGAPTSSASASGTSSKTAAASGTSATASQSPSSGAVPRTGSSIAGVVGAAGLLAAGLAM